MEFCFFWTTGNAGFGRLVETQKLIQKEVNYSLIHFFENGSRSKTPEVLKGKPCWVHLAIFLEKPHSSPISRREVFEGPWGRSPPANAAGNFDKNVCLKSPTWQRKFNVSTASRFQDTVFWIFPGPLGAKVAFGCIPRTSRPRALRKTSLDSGGRKDHFGVLTLAARGRLCTVDYIAPEVLSYEPICLSTDIWSVGVLGYVLLSGFSPFGADDKQQTFLNISKCNLSFEPEHFEDVSSAAIDFIKSALIVDPRKRPTVHELMDHPWISLKSNLMQPLSAPIRSPEPINVTPRSTPIGQRKSFSCLSSDGGCADLTPKSKDFKAAHARTTLSGSFAESPVRTYSVTAQCICAQCGPTCRHLSHAPVTKTTITIDRAILC
ncbi:hypothetical protein HUJ04_000368 [Dendroctonus ponderosae]|nr:hypothetical protein HUJ04_000368 [Dendroctonus ponderosae]